MPEHDNGCGAAVAEITASTELARDFTLFQIEESLVLLAESAEEEGLTPEIERALTVYLEGAAEKRDRVADFMKGWPSWPRPKGRGCKPGRNTSKRQPSA